MATPRAGLLLNTRGLSDAASPSSPASTNPWSTGAATPGLRPTFCNVDSCAAEFAATTPYMYSTYCGPGGAEIPPSDRRKVVILGGGPNRIGQGIEFDYCCVHASFALREMGIETVMVNCNPETVSTDYDTSDRLYFEPLCFEDVLEICHEEQRSGELLGVIVQFGGQTPLRLAVPLERAGIPLLGTPADAIDRAEDRERFDALLAKLHLKRPAARSLPASTRLGGLQPSSAIRAGTPLLRPRRTRHDDHGTPKDRRLHASPWKRPEEGTGGIWWIRSSGRHRGRRGRRLRRRARANWRRAATHRGGGHPTPRSTCARPIRCPGLSRPSGRRPSSVSSSA